MSRSSTSSGSSSSTSASFLLIVVVLVGCGHWRLRRCYAAERYIQSCLASKCSLNILAAAQLDLFLLGRTEFKLYHQTRHYQSMRPKVAASTAHGPRKILWCYLLVFMAFWLATCKGARLISTSLGLVMLVKGSRGGHFCFALASYAESARLRGRYLELHHALEAASKADIYKGGAGSYQHCTF